jgi:O-methyltransferase
MSQPDLIYRWVCKFMPLRHLIHNVGFALEMFLLTGYKKDENTLALIKRVKRESDLFLTAAEAFLIHSLVQAQRRIAGDMAEVGVYKGGSSKLICEAKGSVPLHLFDTFDGLPEPHEKDQAFFERGMVAGSLSVVQRYLQPYDNVLFYPGLFPETSTPVESKMFSFVHLDVDLYQSMLSSLEFFYPRLSLGGIIIAHDYQYPGVRKAFAEFFGDQSDRVIELSNNQCMVIKLSLEEPALNARVLPTGQVLPALI